MRRFPKPWRERPAAESFVVEDAAGFALAYVYFETRATPSVGMHERMSRDQAHRIATAFARIGQ